MVCGLWGAGRKKGGRKKVKGRNGGWLRIWGGFGGFGTEFLGDLVEDAVDESTGLGAAEHFGDFDGFV